MSTENGVYAYIHDGYTRSAYVAPRTRLYPAVRFLYRPMLAQGRAIVSRAIIDTKDVAKAEEIAACVAFLCSPGAAYLTGQTLRVDGGMSLG